MHAVCRRLLPCLTAALLVVPLAALAGAEANPLTPVLLADFELQELGAPIATGGPELGQPVSASLASEVLEGEIDGRSLEVRDNGVSTAVNMRFEFLDAVELASGILTISLQVKPEVGDAFFVRLRENDGAAKNFGQVMLTADGGLRVSDKTGDAGVVAAAGTLAVGTVYTILWVHDLDAGTHSVYLDGAELLADRAHGVATTGPDGRGIGALLIGYMSDASETGILHVDGIEVITDAIPAPPLEDPVFASGFEGEPTT